MYGVEVKHRQNEYAQFNTIKRDPQVQIHRFVVEKVNTICLWLTMIALPSKATEAG